MGAPERKFVIATLVTLIAVVTSPVRAGAAAPTGSPVSDPVPDAAASLQAESDVASAGDGTSLVVWTDDRPSGANADIYGARIGSDGTVLDPTGIPIGTGLKDQREPAVAFNGTDFLVVWAQEEQPQPGHTDVHARRVDVAGQPIGEAFVICVCARSQLDPTVTAYGSSWFVAWEDSSVGFRTDIYGAQVAADGEVLDPSIAISTADAHKSDPSVAFDGENVVVAWMDARNGVSGPNLYAARMSQAGSLLDPSGIPVATTDGFQRVAPAVASSGSASFIVWRDERAGTEGDIYGSRLSRAGTVLDPTGKPVTTALADQADPELAWDGSSYLVVWRDLRSGEPAIFGRRLGAGGGGPSPDRPIATGVEKTGGVAATGAGFLTAFDGPADVGGRRIGSTGIAAGEQIVISTAAARQGEPDIAHDGTNHLVVWSEGAVRADVRAARVGPDGASLDPDGIPVAVDPGTQLTPSVAFDGTHYLVVWSDTRAPGPGFDVFAARVSRAGVVLDPGGIQLTTGGFTRGPPDVAAIGTNFVVVWADQREGDIYGARVSGAGTVLDPQGTLVGDSLNGAAEPAIASAGGRGLVVWEDGDDVRGTRLSVSGAVVDPDGFAVSTAHDHQRDPAVAFDGTRYLVAWHDDRVGGAIYAARVRPDAKVLDPNGIEVSTAPGDQDEPAVAANGSFLVVWRDHREGLVRTTVDGAGSVASPDGRAIAGSSEDDAWLGVAPTGQPGRFRLASPRYIADPPFGATRVFTRSVGPK